jgi:hypothetical protein
MARFESPEGISDVLAAPLGELIAAVGRSVAEAQQAMDGQAIEHFRQIYGGGEGAEAFEALRSIGYQPTWYQIPEATAEITIAFTATGSSDTSSPGSRRLGIYGAPVDAAYQSKFNYGVQASSSLKFRVVPVPPPAAAARMRIAPDLVNLTLASARSLLAELGIELEVTAAGATDASIVTAQLPAAGGVLPTDTVQLITEVRAP